MNFKENIIVMILLVVFWVLILEIFMGEKAESHPCGEYRTQTWSEKQLETEQTLYYRRKNSESRF